MAGSLSRLRQPISDVPKAWEKRYGPSRTKRFLTCFGGGFLILFGARLAGGCTLGLFLSGATQLATNPQKMVLAHLMKEPYIPQFMLLVVIFSAIGLFALEASGAGATLGNIMTYANTGLEIRAGWNVPKTFSVSLIRPAGSNWTTKVSGFSLYLFGAVNGRAVLRDIFLDGNSFRSSHHVDKEPLVADLSGGVTGKLDRLSLSLAVTHRTREFKGQMSDHEFASISISYAF